MTRIIPLLMIVLLGSSCGPIRPIHNPFQQAQSSPPHAKPVDPLKIFVIDIGQGDATLIMGPTGQTLLIDGGPATAGHAHVLPFLQEQGVESINTMIATHYDADHISGLVEVLKGPDQDAGTPDDWIPQTLYPPL